MIAREPEWVLYNASNILQHRFNPDTMTFGPAYTSYSSAYARLSKDTYANNPAAFYIGTSSLGRSNTSRQP